MIKLPKAAVWTCAVFLAVAFIVAGTLKLGGPSAVGWAQRFDNWGYPASARYVIGGLEILGGLGVLFPRWRRSAAAVLIVLLIGALGTHTLHGESRRLVPPLVLGGLACLSYSSRLRS